MRRQGLQLTAHSCAFSPHSVPGGGGAYARGAHACGAYAIRHQCVAEQLRPRMA